MVNINSLNNVMKKKFNSEIDFIHIEEGESDEEFTTVWVAVRLQNGVEKMIEYQYENANICIYGYNIYDFDPTCFKNFFK